MWSAPSPTRRRRVVGTVAVVTAGLIIAVLSSSSFDLTSDMVFGFPDR